MLAEVAPFVALALCLGAFISWRFAREQLFIGTFDLPIIFWQGGNLLRVWEAGEANLTDSFLGLPTPFTYSPSMHFLTLPLLGLTRLTNPWFAYNFLCFLALIANGATFYAVLRLVGLRRDAAVVGGVVYLVTPVTVGRSLVHLCLAQTWYLPCMFGLLYRDRLEGPRACNWIGIGILVALMHGSHEYTGVLGFALLAVALACRLPEIGVRQTARFGALAVAAYTVLSAPVLWTYLSQHAYDGAHGIRPLRPIEESIAMSATPADFLMPSNLSFVYGRFAFFTQENRFTESFNYLGLLNMASVLLLACWAVGRRASLRAFVEESPFLQVLRRELWATAIGALVVSFGPRWKNAPWIVLPVALLGFPPFTMLRGWGRYGFVLFFVLTLLTAHVAQFLLRRARRPALLATVLVVVAFFDQVPVQQIPSFRIALPSALPEIAAEPGRFQVLHLPFHSRSGALHGGVGQLLQVLHGKRVVGGYSAFDPPAFLDGLRNTPLFDLDGATMRDISRADPETFAAWLVESDVRYIVYEKKTLCHSEGFTESADQRLRAATLRVLDALERAHRLSPLEDDDDYRVYRVNP